MSAAECDGSGKARESGGATVVEKFVVIAATSLRACHSTVADTIDCFSYISVRECECAGVRSECAEV